MKKLLVVMVFSSIVSASPSIDEGHRIADYCESYSTSVSGFYILKENGYNKQYVIDAIVSEGVSKDLAETAADTAYELKTGMSPEYVKLRVKKFCINTITGGE